MTGTNSTPLSPFCLASFCCLSNVSGDNIMTRWTQKDQPTDETIIFENENEVVRDFLVGGYDN
jgi:hypothetical protein